jgi:putative ABC transport system ATP-binding protein
MTTGVSDQPIVVSNLNFWFGDGDSRKQILYDITMSVARGSLTALVGASGSGKTTLITLIGCLRTVQEGSISLLDHELLGASEQQLQQYRKRLGFIFQAHNLHESLTAMQNVRLGIEVHGADAMRNWEAAASHMLSLVGLSDHVDYLPSRMSGGQKQRVAVARALVGNPDIILADEPTAALDKEAGLQTIKTLKQLGKERGTTTLLVTHDNRILELVDRVITIDEGRIVESSRSI